MCFCMNCDGKKKGKNNKKIYQKNTAVFFTSEKIPLRSFLLSSFFIAKDVKGTKWFKVKTVERKRDNFIKVWSKKCFTVSQDFFCCSRERENESHLFSLRFIRNGKGRKNIGVNVYTEKQKQKQRIKNEKRRENKSRSLNRKKTVMLST